MDDKFKEYLVDKIVCIVENNSFDGFNQMAAASDAEILIDELCDILQKKQLKSED